MPSNANQFVPSAPDASPVVGHATEALRSFLHCTPAEALALLRAQSHGAHLGLAQVAASVVEADFPDRRWGWKPEPRGGVRVPGLPAASAA